MTSRSRPWYARYSASDLLEIMSEEVSVVASLGMSLVMLLAIVSLMRFFDHYGAPALPE